MSDLPKRLRERARIPLGSHGWYGLGVPDLLREAAEEVERLKSGKWLADSIARGNKLASAVDRLKAQRDEARAEVERLREQAVSPETSAPLLYHEAARLKAEVERLREALASGAALLDEATEWGIDFHPVASVCRGCGMDGLSHKQDCRLVAAEAWADTWRKVNNDE